MQIRSCEAADIEQAALIFCQAYATPPYNESWELADASAYLRRFREIDPQGCFVSEQTGEVTGAIFSFSYPWHSGKLTCIQELFVAEPSRKQGVARTLVQRVNGGLGGGAWLVAHKASGAAEFYERLGFRKDGPYEFYYGAINP
ncbi:GNAT family N-acetyltransferase [Marinobacter subterrani]|uniref:Ribosomal protein S18 acetylase RimI n=1 Tax=Marinobacter subterrani TaxID=1658765 RepID=A0A0J7J853_9GAMM|nr:GNAT family N-acetyltransferase [Marinobacter subterrani]KMQ74066.1 Ribosomal protein S18 acetylase RimI [Marinobacter subterrani]